MLDPTLRAAFVVIFTVALRYAAQYFNIPLDDATLGAIAVALVAWIFGTSSGKATAEAIHLRRNRVK